MKIFLKEKGKFGKLFYYLNSFFFKFENFLKHDLNWHLKKILNWSLINDSFIEFDHVKMFLKKIQHWHGKQHEIFNWIKTQNIIAFPPEIPSLYIHPIYFLLNSFRLHQPDNLKMLMTWNGKRLGWKVFNYETKIDIKLFDIIFHDKRQMRGEALSAIRTICLELWWCFVYWRRVKVATDVFITAFFLFLLFLFFTRHLKKSPRFSCG